MESQFVFIIVTINWFLLNIVIQQMVRGDYYR